MKYSKQEIQNSKRIFKSATPKQDLSWYVKWVGSIILLCAMMFRAEGLYPLADLVLSFIGVSLWLWVALLWRDRALIILNAVAMIVLGSGLLRQFTPLLIA
jgi:hypothetical protein|tara:strand:+ start:1026 stop:1328 length:303 start_codon:yes stop_codon:yes gene_type:complete